MILGIVVFLVIVFVVYSAIKDRIKKNKAKKEKIEFENRANYFQKIYIAKLHYLIEKNNEYLQNFKPSIGKYTMGQIVETAHKFLITFENDKNFKEYIVAADSQSNVLNSFLALRDTRSNLWDKKINETLNLIKKNYNKTNLQISSSEYLDAKKEIDAFYERELRNEKNN
ncbi:MHJ_0274 family protein [Mycoplasmopsis meleagridis]|uniref:MHJ_0274 family protein n=1 Tax=Mycoplasmopsis meleagridis TaxID=29561 RepID=UPI003A89E4EF